MLLGLARSQVHVVTKVARDERVEGCRLCLVAQTAVLLFPARKPQRLLCQGKHDRRVQTGDGLFGGQSKLGTGVETLFQHQDQSVNGRL